MDPNLEAIVAADEECRARIAAAEASAQTQMEKARQESARRQQARRESRQAWLEGEERAIRGDADRVVAERQTLRAKYLEAKRLAAAGVLHEAADLFARIIVDGEVPSHSR